MHVQPELLPVVWVELIGRIALDSKEESQRYSDLSSLVGMSGHLGSLNKILGPNRRTKIWTIFWNDQHLEFSGVHWSRKTQPSRSLVESD